jgi:hypothetical protein
VLTNDPATGVLRHVDAGYERAEQTAETHGLRVPMSEGVAAQTHFRGATAAAKQGEGSPGKAQTHFRGATAAAKQGEGSPGKAQPPSRNEMA